MECDEDFPGHNTPECDKEDESWFTPRLCDLSLDRFQDDELQVDPVEGLTYRGNSPIILRKQIRCGNN